MLSVASAFCRSRVERFTDVSSIPRGAVTKGCWDHTFIAVDGVVMVIRLGIENSLSTAVPRSRRGGNLATSKSHWCPCSREVQTDDFIGRYLLILYLYD